MKMIRPLFRVERRREGALDFDLGGRGLAHELCFGSEGPVERAQSQGDGPPQDDCPWAWTVVQGRHQRVDAVCSRRDAMGFILRVLIVALGLGLASALVPGIQVQDGRTLIGAALLLGIVNALVRPLIVLLTLPITVLTLGLFLLVINAALLGLVASFEGFTISGFWSALLGSTVV